MLIDCDTCRNNCRLCRTRFGNEAVASHSSRQVFSPFNFPRSRIAAEGVFYFGWTHKLFFKRFVESGACWWRLLRRWGGRLSADAAVTFDTRIPLGAAVAILRCRDSVGVGNGFWPAPAPPRDGAVTPPVGGEAELDGAAAGGRVGDGAEPALEPALKLKLELSLYLTVELAPELTLELALELALELVLILALQLALHVALALESALALALEQAIALALSTITSSATYLFCTV
jgi:hypothetical protein